MRAARVAALVAGCLAVLPGVGLLAGGGALAIGAAVARDDAGFFDATLDRLTSDTAAITSDGFDFATEPGSPDWVMDRLDVTVRLRATSANQTEVFLGIARTADLDAYLAGVAHDEVTDVDDGLAPVYARQPGETIAVGPPTGADIWVASATGPGEQELIWDARGGRWSAVVLNATGAPGVTADVDVGVKAGFIVPLAITLLAAGAIVTAIGVGLIVFGARGLRTGSRNDEHDEHDDERGLPGSPLFAPPFGFPAPAELEPIAPSPVQIEARLDRDLSRWRWLVKWFLAIPHLVVLVFLWVAFAVTSVIAWFAILFTGRYPRGLFDFNVGVLRWTWRVQYYASTGGLGTDRYPPFTLGACRDYPAVLDIAYPAHLSRGLVLVKSWLLALPHLLLLGLFAGGTFAGDERTGIGVIGLLVLFAGVALLFTGRYPRSLFDLVIGLNRWSYRVIAYVALMTDTYPPFRLDQGGGEPRPVPAGGPPMAPAPAGNPRVLVDA